MATAPIVPMPRVEQANLREKIKCHQRRREDEEDSKRSVSLLSSVQINAECISRIYSPPSASAAT
eukprot:COSAG06_NODE_41430_length_391_cov_1.068493_1_plen_64_part_10